ncbi:MAG: hypothetical protein K1X49_09845 [Saprospiraceae bacterium]|jgi:nickel/cobalt exporter|nr:hypothetical protein [Saprospiraceae bacterium]
MKEVILSGALMISLMHAIIPSHWLPILTIGKAYKWSKNEVMRLTFGAGMAHVCSTILLGLLASFLGESMNESFHQWFEWLLPVCMILFGLYFLYRHHTHHHFDLHADQIQKNNHNKKAVFYSVLGMMFLSPCIEIVPYFLMAGSYGFSFLVILSFLFLVVSVGGMMIWMTAMYHGLKKLNWHRIEHNAGLLTGLVLIVSGLLMYFFHMH